MLRQILVHTGQNLDVHRQAQVSPRIHNLGFRPPFDMTPAVFKLPAELILEILGHYEDPHYNIRYVKNELYTNLEPGHNLVERLTVIRRLTMTCWDLRNKLLPVLWRYVEGCNFPPLHRIPGPDMLLPQNKGLYAQCSYLLLNPSISTYVECVNRQTFAPRSHSRSITLQNPFRGSILQTRPKRSNDQVHQLSNSVAQPKDLGSFQHQPHQPYHKGAQTKICQIP